MLQNDFCICTVGHASLVAEFVECFNAQRFWEAPIVYREMLPQDIDLFDDGDFCGDFSNRKPSHAVYFERTAEDRNAARYSQIVNAWNMFNAGAHAEKWSDAEEFFAQ